MLTAQVQLTSPRITPDLINTLLRETEERVRSRLDLPVGNDALAVYAGEVDHECLLDLGRRAAARYAALQKKLWEVYMKQTWRQVKITKTHPDNTAFILTDGSVDTYSFKDFDEYFAYLCSPECWDVDGAQKSGLYNGTTKLLALVGQGKLTNDESGLAFTVDDVLCLNTQTQQTLAGVARRALLPGNEKPENVGRALNIARPGSSHEQIMIELHDAGLTGKEDAFPVFYYDTGEDVIFAGRISYTDLKRLTVALRGRADLQLSPLNDIFQTIGVEDAIPGSLSN